jgi:hypothetical protein
VKRKQIMPEHRFEVGIVVARRKLNGPWAEYAWLPELVLPAVPAAAPWTRLTEDGEEELYYAGDFEISLHPSATGHYRDNLTSGRPSLWVALQSVGRGEYKVAAVTADPYEGEALSEGVGEIVESVPMPAEIQAKVAAFFEAFHQERTFIKRKRDRADPEALARGESGRMMSKEYKP